MNKPVSEKSRRVKTTSSSSLVRESLNIHRLFESRSLEWCLGTSSWPLLEEAADGGNCWGFSESEVFWGIDEMRVESCWESKNETKNFLWGVPFTQPSLKWDLVWAAIAWLE